MELLAKPWQPLDSSSRREYLFAVSEDADGFAVLFWGRGRIATVTRPLDALCVPHQNCDRSLYSCALGTSRPYYDDVKHPTPLVSHIIDSH